MNYFNKTYNFFLGKHTIKILLILVSIFILSFDLRSQTTVTINAMKDNTLYEDTTGGISNGAGDHFFSGKTAQGLIRRGLIGFDIAGNIPSCATITSVTLVLHMSRTITGNETIQLRKVNQNWGEGDSDASGDEGGGAPADTNDATWRHTFYNTVFWSTMGGSFSSTVSDSISVGNINFYTWGSTTIMINDVQGWLNNPSSNNGWLLLGNESTGLTSKRFDTRENDSINFRPKLNVTYILNSLSLNLTTLIEGFWNGSSMVSDTVKVYLRNATSPFLKVDSAKVKLDSLGKGIFCFGNATSGSYYIVVTHRNSIETWSSLPQKFAVGSSINYNFTTAASQAFGNNLVLKLGRYTIYSGDVDQEETINVIDLGLVYNDVINSVTGYVRTDLNGDDFVEVLDLGIVYNNLQYSISVITP